jgi:uncharacterized protein (DUF1697 family)
MEKYVALLRGINVSGQKIIKMALLKSIFEETGFSGVKTYLQSGNVIFESMEKNTPILQEQIKGAIKVKLGFDVEIIVKNKDQFENIIADIPFGSEIDSKKIYITLLQKVPEQSKIKDLENYDNGIDKFIIKKDIIYTFYKEGYGLSKFSNNFIEKKLGVTATTRNYNTMTELNNILKKIE